MSTPNTPGAGRGRAPQQQPRTASARPATPPRTGQQKAPQQARQAQQQRPATRPAGAQGQQPKGAQQAKGQAGLVRPAPKAKVRKARLLVSKVDVWSVLKMAFLLSVALGVITVVAGVLLWTIFDVSGVFTRINDLVSEVLPNQQQVFDVKNYVSVSQVTSFAVIIAVVNVVLLSALSMVGAFIYNLASGLVGGISVTLTDD